MTSLLRQFPELPAQKSRWPGNLPALRWQGRARRPDLDSEHRRHRDRSSQDRQCFAAFSIISSSEALLTATRSEPSDLAVLSKDLALVKFYLVYRLSQTSGE